MFSRKTTPISAGSKILNDAQKRAISSIRHFIGLFLFGRLSTLSQTEASHRLVVDILHLVAANTKDIGPEEFLKKAIETFEEEQLLATREEIQKLKTNAKT